MAGYERHIELQGVGNFRDIGGYRTASGHQLRWRQVFRSAQPDEIEAPEAQRLADEFGVTTLIDLRHPTEGNAQVGVAPEALDAAGIEYRNHSLQDRDRPYSELLPEQALCFLFQSHLHHYRRLDISHPK